MKRKVTRIRPDGSKEIVEEMDEAPAMQKAKAQGQPGVQQNAQDALMKRFQGQPGQQPAAPMQNLAAMGRNGDTELAHVNEWEKALLEKLGGAGTQNPQTGLKQYYTVSDVGDWYQNYYGREADVDGLKYWATYGANTGRPDEEVFQAFKNAGVNEQNRNDTYTPLFSATTTGPGYAPYTPPATTMPVTQPAPVTNPPPVVQPPVTTGNPEYPDWFNFPLDIFPSSGGQNAATSTNNSASGGTSQSSNTSGNYSGLPVDYQKQILDAVIPQLTNATTNMEGNYDRYTSEALGSYQQMMQNALRQNIPTALASLANRGILNSTEGQKVLGNVASTAAIDASTKGYETAMQNALMKAQMPNILANLASLGKTSYGTSQGSSSSANAAASTGQSQSAGTSFSQDPTVMYRTMADLIRSMM